MELRKIQIPNLGKLSKVLMYLVLFGGALLRVFVWLQNRALFIDEANLARNFCEKSPADFFQVLGYDQFAPPLFSLVQKCSVQVFGQQELALRLFPMLCSLASIWLFFQIAKRLISSNWVLLATVWIFCFSDFFLRYATEGKQYGCDLALALALVGLGLNYAERNVQLTVPHLNFNFRGGVAQLILALIGALAIWLSMPAVFVLFGLGMYALHAAWRQKDRNAQLRIIGVLSVWLLSFAFNYWFILRPSFSVAPLMESHQPWFFPLLPTSAADWRWAADLLLVFPYHTAGFTVLAKFVGSAGILTGLVWLCRNKNRTAWLLAAPVFACLLASGFGQYSLMSRLLIWAFPLVLLLQGLGWQKWWDAGQKWYWKGLCLLLMGLTAGLHNSWQYFGKPFQIEEIRQVLDVVRQDFQPGDVLLVSHEAWPAVAYYRDCHEQRADYEFGDQVRRFGLDGPLRRESLAIGGAQPRRVWLVFSHVISAPSRVAMQTDLTLMGAFAAQKKAVERVGAFGFLFVLN